ncbi:apolipoprotein N-acyltransferase [Rodentibacter rarus]|uniref:Apolipoprotein N-acyltransferase n=1 Tax=Rodentibacter rarus TaxID=1908260 RepID=A0A1V3IQA4_9PAST|nr:apolipoprotein N-acyltransferase [Rodentibacter rarus]OOF42079.1 apolipoprotein N-acyltransferase [Rodentibacter rarus]OOF44435.1 apolipoprotein N-acyltransferase [Rodentibacter rarus]
MKHLLTYFIAIVSGIIGVFAFSPFDYWAMAYLSLLGLLYVAKSAKKSTALLGTFLWAMGFFCFGVSWLNVSIHQFGGASLGVSYFLVALLSAYLALYPMLFTYLVQRFQVQSAVIFAAIWTFTEFLRGWVLTGFPWLQFGYTQIDSPFAGIAPIFGVDGLTFFTVWGSAVIFNGVLALVKEKNLKLLLANGLLLATVGGLAACAQKITFVKPVEDKAITITLAQGNIEQNLKWDPEYFYSTLEIYQKLIAENLGKSDLIILPESALPTLENHIVPFFESLERAAKEQNTEMMIGTVYQHEQSGKLLNSIVTVGNPDFPYHLSTNNRYSKHHLVPFGEYVPLEKWLRPLNSVFNLPMSAFQRGEAIQPSLMAKQRAFSPAICYEIIFGEQVRENLKKETDYLLTISNDAWFGDSIGPWQHLQMARMRALELGKPLIRATNTGISVFIGERGEILAQAPQFVETTLSYNIAPTEGKTPYSVLGNMPLYGLSLLFLMLRGLMTYVHRRMNLS